MLVSGLWSKASVDTVLFRVCDNLRLHILVRR